MVYFRRYVVNHLFRKWGIHTFLKTPLIFSNGPHLVALTRFQATFRRSKLPCSHFSPKRHIHHLTFYGPSQYLSSFPSNRPKSKKFPCPSAKIKYRARIRSILMPPTLHTASLNCYTPQAFRGTPEVDLVSIVCPPCPPKMR